MIKMQTSLFYNYESTSCSLNINIFILFSQGLTVIRPRSSLQLFSIVATALPASRTASMLAATCSLASSCSAVTFCLL